MYLTSPESMENNDVPKVLAEAVRGANAKIMVPLACKNNKTNTWTLVAF